MRVLLAVFSILFLAHETATKSIYQAYVINLPKRPERLASIAGQLDKEGIPYVVQNAISPEDIEAEVLARKNNEPSPGAFDPETKLNFTTGIFPKIRQTELGCFQSHVQALIKISKSKTNDPVLILEDDAKLKPKFYSRSISLFSKLPATWDLVHIGYCGRANCESFVEGRKAGFCKIKRSPLFCTHGYFINGARAAKTILKSLNIASIDFALDFVLYNSTVNYFAIVPKLVTQVFEFGSDNGNGMDRYRSY
jgi:GR25 family glycosyltransferase involved in LPS biosynthesis